jgi:hypothetical protein
LSEADCACETAGAADAKTSDVASSRSAEAQVIAFSLYIFVALEFLTFEADFSSQAKEAGPQEQACVVACDDRAGASFSYEPCDNHENSLITLVA